jgi:hypothetical protein
VAAEGAGEEAVNINAYIELRGRVRDAGYQSDIEWSEAVKPPTLPLDFFMEYAWVVLNGGMKEQVARKIWERILAALDTAQPVASAFGHAGKAAAIQEGWNRQDERFEGYQVAEDKLAYLRSLPWIGPITVYHLAKNCGVDCAKPDRHLMRIAAGYSTTPAALCSGLAAASGDRIATVDYVLWRAANLGFI